MEKTKKKEDIVDLNPKPEKVTDVQLKKIQDVVSHINRLQMEIGMMETRKAYIIRTINTSQDRLGVVQKELGKDYGTTDIDIQTGVIKYPEENGEADKKD